MMSLGKAFFFLFLIGSHGVCQAEMSIVENVDESVKARWFMKTMDTYDFEHDVSTGSELLVPEDFSSYENMATAFRKWFKSSSGDLKTFPRGTLDYIQFNGANGANICRLATGISEAKNQILVSIEDCDKPLSSKKNRSARVLYKLSPSMGISRPIQMTQVK